MKFQQIITAIAALAAPMSVLAKSQDYARHIELSLLFYEAQRSGVLPENNRIYWRHDSMTDSGADNGVDLNGGYYDAGDNVKFNFPGAASMTLLAWSGIDLADGYKNAGQWDYLLDAVRWGADYFMKCHTGKNELYVQVGDGTEDHAHWYPPEYASYNHPSFKVTADAPGSEVAGETAAFLAAASILFKDVDPSYSASCLEHAKEIYDFADTYRGDYIAAVPGVVSFYSTYSGYNDELAWGAAWLLRATGNQSYLEKYNKIANVKYDPWDTKKFSGATGPISWDDKRPGAYILIAMTTGDENRIKEAYAYCDAVMSQKQTPGGLWYDDGLSLWASNRYAANAASMVAMFANQLPESDPKRAKYVDFVKSQIDYILGDNPNGINYVVGAEENSPKAVHHRGASGTFDSQDKAVKPDFNVYTLWGALAGGPGKNDEYTDSRKNYEMNEVALDYNAGFQLDLAFLTKEGLSVPDSDSVKNHERSFPKRPDASDARITFKDGELTVATGSGMMCSSWCVTINNGYKIDRVHDSTLYKAEHPEYIICNKRETNFLDGEGTSVKVTFAGSGDLPKEFVFLCDGFHAPLSPQEPTYKPENGRQYKVIGSGGPENTIPMFEETSCWPGFLCDGSSPKPTTTIKKTTTTTVKTTTSSGTNPTSPSDDCFAKKLGYKCCNDNEVIYTDDDGNWGQANGEWCGIGGGSVVTPETCKGYPCCSSCDSVYTDADGNWGVENDEWCLVKESQCGGNEGSDTCPNSSEYPCCESCSSYLYSDDTGKWGVEGNEWCSIKDSCN